MLRESDQSPAKASWHFIEPISLIHRAKISKFWSQWIWKLTEVRLLQLLDNLGKVNLPWYSLVPHNRILPLKWCIKMIKTNQIKLIERFYDLTGGSVLLDDRDIKDLDVNWLRDQIGLVSQEPILFNLSIRENIIYGWENPSITVSILTIMNSVLKRVTMFHRQKLRDARSLRTPMISLSGWRVDMKR